ncbi:DUF5072 family protein [Bacillus sp. MRMR6]|uniref:DUF5072 family protein n=1 Tax=Bacillus sp. MRMR6 TaxID=1928617 RepID=UPI0009518F7B|nr:DUF5072 family protein [Bacillus sp. MRMR6]OLS39139.1 DUF5072 domain-containing protein [Bacillus sp. MRMR6]
MIKKLSFTTVLAAVIKKVQDNTGLRCYDSVPSNAPMPFYYAEIVGQVPDPSKTMWKERYQIFIHVFADGQNGSVPIFDAIQKLEEALSEEIELPEEYEVIMQTPTGVQQIMDEADGTKHAIMGYDFTIFYGYKMKI